MNKLAFFVVETRSQQNKTFSTYFESLQ